MSENVPRLQVTGVTKRFGGVAALRGVDLSVGAGEVHAVIGENGAGKSTLMKILAGVQPPDSGQILLAGQAFQFENVQQAMQQGIALIHQELNLADNLDVGANIFLGREPTRFGLIDSARIHSAAQEYLDKVGLDVPSTQRVSDLPIGQQQLVEIAKALSINANVLIMDEPTSSLSLHETQQLFSVIRNLREQGATIVYISHRLAEVEELADRVTVLRDGENAGNLERAEITHEAMVQRMVGRDIAQFYARVDHQIGRPLLEVHDLRTSCWPEHKVTLNVGAGEMVGLAGLVGAGRTELLAAIFGVDRPLGGSVRVNGTDLQLGSCRDAIAHGLAMVPEDRKHHGLLLEEGVRFNIGLPSLFKHRYAGGLLNAAQERAVTRSMVDRMRIKTPNDAQPTQYLSGGNQQKVVIGKWLAMQPQVLLLDEPTRGVDIGAKQEIYKLMEELAEQGVAILFVSSDLEEVLSMSDRILVMHEGRINGTLNREQASEEAVMQLATANQLAVAGEEHQS